MSHDDDFIAQLEDYLETYEGTTPLPGRVRRAIHAALPTTQQVRPRPGPLRMLTMLSNASAAARFGLAAAAIVIAAVLVAAVTTTNGNRGVVGGASAPSATPSPTAAPSAVSSPVQSAPSTPLPLSLGSPVACAPADTGKSCLEAGPYQLSPSTKWPVTVTFVVPTGWFEWDPGGGTADAVLANGGPEVQYGGSGWGILFGTVGDVVRDPCDPAKGVIPAAQVNTPQKLAAAMAAWPKFKATTPQPIAIEGHSGLRFQMTSTNAATCANTGSAFPWNAPTGEPVNTYPMVNATGVSMPGTFEIVDTGNGLLLIRMTDFPQTSPTELAAGVAADPTRHANDQIALHGILDGIHITALGSG